MMFYSSNLTHLLIRLHFFMFYNNTQAIHFEQQNIVQIMNKKEPFHNSLDLQNLNDSNLLVNNNRNIKINNVFQCNKINNKQQDIIEIYQACKACKCCQLYQINKKKLKKKLWQISNEVMITKTQLYQFSEEIQLLFNNFSYIVELAADNIINKVQLVTEKSNGELKTKNGSKLQTQKYQKTYKNFGEHSHLREQEWRHIQACFVKRLDESVKQITSLKNSLKDALMLNIKMKQQIEYLQNQNRENTQTEDSNNKSNPEFDKLMGNKKYSLRKMTSLNMQSNQNVPQQCQTKSTDLQNLKVRLKILKKKLHMQV